MANIVSYPEFDTIQTFRTILSVVYFIGEIATAIVRFTFTVFMVRSRFRIEVALAKHRTTACFNYRGIDSPLRYCWSHCHSGIFGKTIPQPENQTDQKDATECQCNFENQTTLRCDFNWCSLLLYLLFNRFPQLG